MNRINILIAAVICLAAFQFTAAQTIVSTTGSNTIAYTPGDIAANYFLDGYNYNNNEIRSLEFETNQLSSLYLKTRGRNYTGYSADKYRDLSENEKRDIRSRCRYGRDIYISTASRDEDKDKTLEQKAEEYFSKFIQPYLTGNKDNPVNKQKLGDDIKRNVEKLFDMKETEKQKRITKLEEQIRSLQSTMEDRKKNKNEIVENRLNDLLGVPNKLRW